MGSSDQSDTDSKTSNHCAKCGACTPVCPVFRASGNEIYSARGKQHLAEVFKDQQPGPVFEDIYSKCLLCGACSEVCPQHIDISDEVIEAAQRFRSCMVNMAIKNIWPEKPSTGRNCSVLPGCLVNRRRTFSSKDFLRPAVCG